MSTGPPVSDEGEGCGAFGCLWAVGLVAILIYAYGADMTVRQISLTVVIGTVALGAGWLLTDTVIGAWQKWRGRKHGGA